MDHEPPQRDQPVEPEEAEITSRVPFR
jgi:hypothetical protein